MQLYASILLLCGAVSAAPTLVARASKPSLSLCDLSKASMPVAPSPLPPVSEGLVLSHVAIGRGTQNYTCATNTGSSTPVAIGAYASLFNASCVAATYPQLLTAMPGAAIKAAVPISKEANTLLSGHHYFLDNSTPYFNLNTADHVWGGGAVKKAGSTPAPNANDVPWLKLARNVTEGNAWAEVYRVNTVGGQPPKTCDGMQSTFTVQYSSEYWLYVKPSSS